MIVIKSVKFKNFLSFGNTWTEFEFTKNKKTLIIGSNGQGKSTLIDVIVYGLFGKPYRKISKGGLVNSINKKELVVEITVHIKDKVYKIIRGSYPNIFEIYVDGDLLDQDASIRDYQKVLENDILSLNYRTFTQIVILGSGNYVQFMRLGTSAKREIIEDILDISVFSRMNELLKAQAKEEVNALRGIEDTKELHKKQYNFVLEKSKKSIISKDDQIQRKQQSIEELKENIDSLALEKDNLTMAVRLVEPEAESKSKKNKLQNFKVGIQKNISQIDGEIVFYEEHDECPTCKKILEAEFKSHRVSFLGKKKKELAEALQKLNNSLASVVDKLNTITTTKKSNAVLQNKMTALDNKIQGFKTQIVYLESDIKDIQSEDNSFVSPEELQSLKVKVQEADKELQAKHAELKIMKIGLDILKDSGAKTSIIKFYLPLINKTINSFLEKFDFNVSFMFDENFDESIKARYIDTFNYGNFSEGEKRRIDLALMFTWREIAKMKNSAATNLLFFDEILDSSMDAVGLDNFMQIIDNFDPAANLFVISHREGVESSFDNVVVAKKAEQFSFYEF